MLPLGKLLRNVLAFDVAPLVVEAVEVVAVLALVPAAAAVIKFGNDRIDVFAN